MLKVQVNKNLLNLVFFLFSTLVSLAIMYYSKPLFMRFFSDSRLNCKFSSLTDINLILILLLICGVVLFLIAFFTKDLVAHISGGMIWGGALSNLLESGSGGCVLDYFSISGIVSFNVPDIFIVIGIILMCVKIIKLKLTQKKKVDLKSQ